MSCQAYRRQMRTESEGVYQFGSKRVAVKVEKDNINLRFWII